MCGNFYCTKNSLLGINFGYLLVSVLLISVATYSKTSAYVDSLPIVGGITFCGVFLLFVALLGAVGAIKHHQVMLFFYMILLFLIFVIQLSVAAACLAVSQEQELNYAHQGWNSSDDRLKFQAESYFHCCGFLHHGEGVKCDQIPACLPYLSTPAAAASGGGGGGDEKRQFSCPPCVESISNKIDYAFNSAGGLGLFFAFTEILGCILACRYRNQFDPRSSGPNFLYSGHM